MVRSVVWPKIVRSFGLVSFGHLAASKLKVALGVAVADVGDHVVDEREFGLWETPGGYVFAEEGAEDAAEILVARV